MTKAIRITVEVLDVSSKQDEYKIDPAYGSKISLINYENRDVDSVYEEANELSYIVSKIASSG